MKRDGVPIKKEHGEVIYDFLKAGLSNETIFSKSTLFAWPETKDVCIFVDEKYIIISYLCKSEKIIVIAPLVKEKEDFIEAVCELEKRGIYYISQVNDWQAEILQNRGYELTLWDSRSEYLYNPQDLITLRGKKFHGKRNFINGFKYKYEYRPYNGSEDDKKGIMELFSLNIEDREEKEKKRARLKSKKKEFVWHNSDLEYQAIQKLLDDYDFFNVEADVLLIDGKIEGFVAGEILPNGIGGIYFQKGNTQFRGIYAMIDNLYCKAHFNTPKVRYINKQEDLGLEGLRKAKNDYRPVAMARLYTARAPEGIRECPCSVSVEKDQK